MGGTDSSRVCIAQFSLWLLGSLSTSSLTNIGLFKCAVRLHASIVAQMLRTASAYGFQFFFGWRKLPHLVDYPLQDVLGSAKEHF